MEDAKQEKISDSHDWEMGGWPSKPEAESDISQPVFQCTLCRRVLQPDTDSDEESWSERIYSDDDSSEAAPEAPAKADGEKTPAACFSESEPSSQDSD